MGVCDFPDGIFYLVGGASERFCVAGFEGGGGAVFLGDIVVLLLEVEHGGVCGGMGYIKL